MDMNDYVYQDLMEELRDRRTDATEMDARIRQLLGDTEQLRKERDELCQRVENIKSGFEGCCYACEPVGEMNKKLLKERDESRWFAKEAIDALTKERDEARREVSMRMRRNPERQRDFATGRGWDCFKEETP